MKGKYKWSMVVECSGGEEEPETVSVYTDTEDYYEAEQKALDLVGGWSVIHFRLVRPDGSTYRC